MDDQGLRLLRRELENTQAPLESLRDEVADLRNDITEGSFATELHDTRSAINNLRHAIEGLIDTMQSE